MKKVALVGGVFVSGAALASPPAVVGGMEHVFVSYDGTTLSTWLDVNADASPNVLEDRGGASYTGAAGVLSGRMINDQYGWLADGFISLGSGEGIWVEAVSVSAGLDVYEGGRRPMRADHTYDAILGTDGSSAAWQWNGVMTHNWYAADALGSYEATYRVYIGDAVTGADLGISSDTVTLTFVAVPAPGSAAVVAVAGVLASRRRRSGGGS